MKAFIFPLLFASSLTMAASDAPLQRYQCDEGQSFTIRMTTPDSLELLSGWTFQKLPHVISASGAKYSDGSTTVWLKGQGGFLEVDEVIVANNCTLISADEPLNPIRDAASGLIFIPPERWTANNVQVDVKSGSEIPFYGETALQQFEYRFRGGNDSEHYPLLDILVFPKSAWTQLEKNPPPGLVLGDDGQRVYLAQLPSNNPFNPASKNGKEFIALQMTPAEVKQAFSMYGIVKNKAIESVSAKVMWLDRRLYPGAVLTVELRDVSKMDVASELIAKKVITLTQGTPPTVTLKFAPEAINPKHRYSISARLEQDGKLIKISDTQTPVLTQGAPRETSIMLKAI
ncbi:YbaY family lipoprotein [Deefgea piscis]|uniref:YbaY family lipoprotein n=1 Tax=Deefgea piscis TaxID=2739061 RepID=UPI001C816CDF|nr:YbaY family lipoprotein [Deefgea piscis]QZA81315.1 YbaY family lipoprotein [Deefgea piscis]